MNKIKLYSWLTRIYKNVKQLLGWTCFGRGGKWGGVFNSLVRWANRLIFLKNKSSTEKKKRTLEGWYKKAHWICIHWLCNLLNAYWTQRNRRRCGKKFWEKHSHRIFMDYFTLPESLKSVFCRCYRKILRWGITALSTPLFERWVTLTWARIPTNLLIKFFNWNFEYLSGFYWNCL